MEILTVNRLIANLFTKRYDRVSQRLDLNQKLSKTMIYHIFWNLYSFYF